MIRTISQLARHWSKQTDNGKGIRLEAADVDLLNASGVGALIQKLASEEQCELSRDRISTRARPKQDGPAAAPVVTFRTSTPDEIAHAARRAQRATQA